MDGLAVLALAIAAAFGVALIVVWRGRGRGSGGGELDRLIQSQQELAGRLAQLTESQTNAQAQLGRTLEERLGALNQQIGENLQQSATRTAHSIGELKTRLNVIDEAQKNITALAGQVVSLQDLLANKQARGAFGEIQLNDLVTSILPPSAYAFQATLSNGTRADCLLTLPNPPGGIAIDAKFPLESYHALRNSKDEAQELAARKALANDVLLHVKAIASKYIVTGETADSAIMFLPSEAIYAELHANFPDVVEKSWRARVWIVSPTTLMATLNTIRAVLRDARMREQAHVIQAEVQKLMDDVKRLDDRIGKLQQHFDQAGNDIRQARISTDKIVRRSEQIEELQLEDADPAAAIEPPTVT